ncbi:hypothetical protein Smp_004200.1 [Schistosoma mansoni]|uniref:hypothetical protein n=1 Tax=Schistosoma mansoni TaxID=6183 RepID=UPI0001A64415|nr:hypothetical protein Smp_004200.1 [Schistosoma mansoni]|eukprot:XP_018650236.1 hypothetical protein Smp_004200.1 [Schistosoma mansoni]
MLPNKSESFAPSVGNELTRNFKNLGEPVYVNVYHLHWPNGLKMGAYHTGTVVYDREFGFGGHPFASSGIFQTTPMDIDSLGEEISFKIIRLPYLSSFQYNVLLLCHGVLPKWINRLARIVSGLPFIETFLPPHWIRPSLMYDCEFDELSNDDEEEERTKEDINQNDQNEHLINGNTNDNNNNQIVCYKNEDEDLSITKSFTEKPYFQFVHSTSTNNGHVPHRTTNSIANNNKTSVDHSDNHHHDSSLFQLRTV